ncbi:probable acyl-activating enzyme 16, chloroplastic isoform X2 [Telopea speciosissima]|uniref:probable acyl-activating enzyme 16, chloroplastic isoform X2 n=1 Tax=Telopea speciosissima TaxID=54955 RepID=UPI001CC6DD61|nr:probable acyl-activating enzyme 16, chloroplastic isoform X2 [Telopea speciosissima]
MSCLFSVSTSLNRMTSVSLHSNLISSSFDHGPGLGPEFAFLLPLRCLGSAKFSYRRCVGGRFFRLARRPTIKCEFKTLSEEQQVRRCSPLLESVLLPSDNIPDSGDWKAVPDIWKSSAEKYGDRIALVDPYHDPPSELTYKQLEQQILEFSEGLRVVGLKPDEKLALFADNSCRWLVADQGIMATGAINVVRGTRSSNEELLHIYNHSESVALVVDNPDFFNRIAETFISRASIKFIILLWGEKSGITSKVTEDIAVFSFKETIELGRESHQKLINSHKEGLNCIYEAINSDDIATLVYTSGTTGNPKGVMLTHQNLLHQIRNFWDMVPAVPGDRFLSMLPSWHAYERAAEYFIFTCGVEQVYTSVQNLKEDLKHYQPHYLIAVPLVYETLYRGIQKQISASSTARKLVALTFIKISLEYMEFKRICEGKFLARNPNQPPFLVMFEWLLARIICAILWPLHILGSKLVYSKILSAIGISKAGISGGGSLPLYVDRFFEAIGVQLQNGYGLTEASPVVAARRPACNVLGSVGHPLRDTEVKVVDSETDEILPSGSKGIIKVRGPQVMKGYFKNPSATKQVLDKDGWLNTGDIGWISPNHSRGRSCRCGGVIVLEGRAKDTIVLTTGENVEPSEIEEAALQSNLIQQIVIIGQDQRRLGAIIVPNKEEIAKKLSILDADSSEFSKEKMTNLLRTELQTWTSECSFHIGPILIADAPFMIDGGLMTPTMKIRRDKVIAKYSDQIAELYK